MSTLIQDVRFALRMLAKSPGFTVVVVIALSLGIGANTTVFTLVNAVLFRGLPFEHPDRIMHLTSGNPLEPRRDAGVSFPDLEDWRAQSKTFQGIAAFNGNTFNVADAANAPERYFGSRVTANCFRLIGQQPILGRDFLPGEDKAGAPAVALIGYSMWKTRYGSDPKIIGRVIRLNEVPTVVVGVMPEDMKFPANADLWAPLAPSTSLTKRDERGMEAFGRLADGFTLEQAHAEMDTIAARLKKSYPDTNKNTAIIVTPFNDRVNGGRIRVVFLALLGAVGFVLLIACANVANLMLARSVARSREMSIRAALGAGRWRIVRQLLTESVVLGILGGVLGLFFAVWGVRAFDLAVADTGKPYWIKFEMDFAVFAYLAVICVGTGIVFGLIPALQAARRDANSSLKDGGRGSAGAIGGKWLSGSLVVGECSLALILLAGAGLMIRSFVSLYTLGQSFDSAHIEVARIALPEAKYKSDESVMQFQEQLRERLAALPGVRSVALASHTPMAGAFGWRYEIEGQPPVAHRDRMPAVMGIITGPGYFETVGVKLLRGRDFEKFDGMEGKEAIIVSQEFASQTWPGKDPVGKRMRLIKEENKQQPWLTVVGVSSNVMTTFERTEQRGVIFVPLRQDPPKYFAIVAASGSPDALVAPFRKGVQTMDADLPLFNAMTLAAQFEKNRWAFRVFGTLFAIFAMIAFSLATVGIYAVMAHGVTQRSQEIGVRLALGANRRDVLSLVMSRGLVQIGVGLALGLTGAAMLTRVLSALLVDVSATDPLTFAAISALLLVAGLCACIVPAHRALRVDPVTALRYE